MPRRHKRRRRSLTNPAGTPSRRGSSESAPPNAENEEAPAADFVDIGQNDDAAERTQARRSRARRRSFAITPVSSHRSRRGASPFSGRNSARASRRRRVELNDDQLTDLYQQCIKLSQHGKIDQKNAWQLSLVEHMDEVMHLNEGNQENRARNANQVHMQQMKQDFAKASHTIDAASKIYGYRVDSVHNATYKVLGSIHQNEPAELVLDADGNIVDTDALEAEKRKRRSRNRNVGKSTLVNKIESIQISVKDLISEVDPMFHKTATTFDEGGAKGLLMNQLYVQNGCEIVFDSSTKIEQNDNIINQGISADVDEDAEAVKQETAWMTQLYDHTFSKTNSSKINPFASQFSQAIDYDGKCTQMQPENFAIDVQWLQTTDICASIQPFLDHITSMDPSKKDDINYSSTQLHCNKPKIDASNLNLSPEKAYDASFDGGAGVSGMSGFADDNEMFVNDNDVMMEMPDLSLGGANDKFDVMNAHDLFHEFDESTQVVHAERQDMHNMSLSEMGANAQPALINVDNMSMNATNTEYVIGQNVRVNQGTNQYLSFTVDDTNALLQNIQKEQMHSQAAQLHNRGMYRTGAMNLQAMNDVVKKLEHSDLETLTSFFDPTKHGNWAGPDQWYHRRYQLTVQKHKRFLQKQKARSKTNSDSDSEKKPKKKKRKKAGDAHIDFISIAKGNFIPEKEFEEPARSNNTLTEAVLKKNSLLSHCLPKDLQIKPGIFVKLFHRPNYSVWKHWLRQHHVRMRKLKESSESQDNQLAQIADANPVDRTGITGIDETNEQILAQQAAATMAVMNDEDEDVQRDFYDYNNANDTSNFVPEFNPASGMADDNEFGNFADWNINGMEMVEAPRKVHKIKVEFSTRRKKIDVRKLKLRMWEQIVIKKEATKNAKSENTEMEIENDTENIDPNVEQKEEEKDKGKENEETPKAELCTFQDTLDSLQDAMGARTMSNISVSFCFISLLLLANEKELALIPQTDVSGGRGNFSIGFADDCQLLDDKAAKDIRPVMILGQR